ncbi:unnamed protein product, partial [Staurois parvus]
WTLVGGTGGHRWVALLGTGRWHFWAQVVTLLGGTGGRTAGWHRWAHCWAQVGALLGTGGRNLCVALLRTDHQGTDDQ